MDAGDSLDGWMACPHCDALIHESEVPEGRSLICVRCGSVVLRHRHNPMIRTLALSSAGLMLYVPANFLPVMSLEILGSSAHNTMLKGVVQLWGQGYLWMATLVFLCSMALPLIELTALFLLSLAGILRRFHPWHRGLLRRVHTLREWGMLEVYMLGILVALVKLSDLGDTHVDIALFCFSGLLACSLGAAMSFDAHALWRMLDHAKRQPA